MNKKIIETKQYNIQFTEEEMAEFGWEDNQKFEVNENEDGSIILKPYVKLEIELDNLSKEELIALMDISCEKDISMNDVIRDILMEAVNESETNI